MILSLLTPGPEKSGLYGKGLTNSTLSLERLICIRLAKGHLPYRHARNVRDYGALIPVIVRKSHDLDGEGLFSRWHFVRIYFF